MPSRLADASSAYLRSAAHQPVDWHPWGPEAFARARSEGKPILLDIGAVWCHWCHVMDGESYEDPALAELLNRDWICVKVDRDERPDVDARYQRAVQMISGQGGWPLTAFLTPEGDVFYGGTYFPPDGKHGRPGFSSVLAELARVFGGERERVGEQVDALRKRLDEMHDAVPPGAVDADALSSAADGIARVFDFRYGGFGSQPKFPHPTACEFLLMHGADTGLPWAREMVDRTLTAMARGGVYDQIGGGFHRYSVDARWVVPHFEKMSYDNSELLKAYVGAATSLPSHPDARGRAAEGEGVESEYRRIIGGVAGWVMTVMSDPQGGYFASQDADVGLHDDGDYFTWTADEVRAVVSDDELAVLVRRYDIGERGEMHHNPAKNVLWIAETIEGIAAHLDRTPDEIQALLASGCAKLVAARSVREAPFVDTTLYVGWNAMMASAMLRAGAYLEREDVDRHALRTLERLTDDVVPPDALRHAVGSDVAGLLDDHVQLAQAALDAFEVTGHTRWKDVAERLMEIVWMNFRDAEGMLLDRRPGDGEGLLTRPVRPLEDAPTPSATGVAGVVLARLAAHIGDTPWGERLAELMSAVGGAVANLGLHGASLLLAAGWHIHPPAHIVVVTDGSDDGRRLHLAARNGFHPRKVLTLMTADAERALLPAPVRAMLDGAAPRAYVCVGTQCSAPISDPAALLTTLAGR